MYLLTHYLNYGLVAYQANRKYKRPLAKVVGLLVHIWGLYNSNIWVSYSKIWVSSLWEPLYLLGVSAPSKQVSKQLVNTQRCLFKFYAVWYKRELETFLFS